MRHPFIRFVTTVCSRRFPVLGIGLLLASLLAPAFAQESCGTDPATSPNHSSHYILGETDVVASAMHWSTGLVWQRCTQGTSGADCTVGSYESRIWNDWMDQYTPRSFAGQEDWWDGGATGPLGFDRLQDGSWRLAYLKELDYLHSGCLVAPRSTGRYFQIPQRTRRGRLRLHVTMRTPDGPCTSTAMATRVHTRVFGVTTGIPGWCAAGSPLRISAARLRARSLKAAW